MITSATWVIYEGSLCRGDNIKNPSWNDVENLLEQVLSGKGSINLSSLEVEHDLSRNIEVQANAGDFLITLSEDDGDTYKVSTFDGSGSGDKKIDFFGELWDERHVCRDQNVVRKIFHDFFLTKDVDNKLFTS